MNRFVLSIALGLFTFFSSWAQNETIVLNYVSELPFQTSNDSEYYHLESSLLLRKITKDILEFVEASMFVLMVLLQVMLFNNLGYRFH